MSVSDAEELFRYATAETIDTFASPDMQWAVPAKILSVSAVKTKGRDPKDFDLHFKLRHREWLSLVLSMNASHLDRRSPMRLAAM